MFPLTLLGLCTIISCRDLHMWAKVWVCFAALQFGRAVCHVSTVVPDAQGWQACKGRLVNSGADPDALKDMAGLHIDENTSFTESLGQILHAEVKGMRYCG